MMDRFDTPVVLIVFNRVETTRQVFAAIAAMRPSRLFVIADGAREERAGESETCRQVRAMVSAVDWPCELHTNFSVWNQGCDARIVSGLDWVFSMVPEAIILEDDCLPDPSFFAFCAELLERFRDDDRVAAISGTNLVRKAQFSGHSYLFSLLGNSWGWATWKSAWERLDRRVLGWPALSKAGALEQIFDDRRGRKLWTQIFNEIHLAGETSPWDYRWTYTKIFEHRLTIVPCVNLVKNIGFGPGASHTTNVDARHLTELHQMSFPLVHPEGMIWSRQYDRMLQTRIDYDLTRRVINKLRRIRSGLLQLQRAALAWRTPSPSHRAGRLSPIDEQVKS